MKFKTRKRKLKYTENIIREGVLETLTHKDIFKAREGGRNRVCVIRWKNKVKE